MDSDGASGEEQDGNGSPIKVSLTLIDKLLCMSLHQRFKHVFTEKGEEIQNVPVLQKRVKGNHAKH